MPEPNRAPWLIEPAIAGVTVGQLIERRVAINLACHACPHWARWTADELTRRFGNRTGLTLRQLAPRIRCSRCRSEWVEIGRARASGAPGNHRR
jgi:hypothetical protein